MSRRRQATKKKSHLPSLQDNDEVEVIEIIDDEVPSASKQARKNVPPPSISSSSSGSTVSRTPTFKPPQAKKKGPPPPSARKLRPRRKPGELAADEIKHFQSTTGNLIPNAPFKRLVDEILHNMAPGFRFSGRRPRCALQSSSEAHVTGTLNDSNLLGGNANRVTTTAADIRLARVLRFDNGN